MTARDLVRRLRACQGERRARATARDHVGAHRVLEVALSLVEDERIGIGLLREALLVATNPAGGQPPAPVALGPHDVAAAIVGVEEILAMVAVYTEASIAWTRKPDEAATELCRSAYAAIREELERLCNTAPTYELGGGRS